MPSNEKTTKIERMGIFWLLFAVESLGQLIIFIQGVPAFRGFVARETYESGPSMRLAVWLLGGALFIQGAYWVNRSIGPSLTLGRNVVLGQAMLFLGRINIILVGSVFSTNFFIRYEHINFSAFNLVWLITILFSVYCYSSELERLGRGFGA